VATVSEKFFSWSDTYGIDVVEGEDDLAILATCLIIDLVCHDDDDRALEELPARREPSSRSVLTTGLPPVA